MNTSRLSYLLITFLPLVRSDTWHVSSTSPFPMNYMQTLTMEGLCNNGKQFILNSKNQIFIMTNSFDIITQNLDAIPHSLREEFQYNHLGDCDYSNAYVYFPVEEPSYTIPAIFVYKLTDNSIEFVNYKAQSAQAHMPWIAMDPTTNILYSSDYYNISTLLMYNTDLEYVGSIKLNSILDEVQGGAFYDGLLYIGVNKGDTVYAVDITTGDVSIAVTQNDPGSDAEYEFEGLTFLDLRDKGMGLMHNTGNHHHPAEMTHALPNDL